jgi:hypothetical protein
MDRVAFQDKIRVLRDELEKAGLTETEAIGRIVKDYLGVNPKEDQVRDLAAIFASVFGMKPKRFVALWLAGRERR